MRDLHQQSEKVAEREVKVKQIDSWLKKERKGRKGAKGKTGSMIGRAPGAPASAAADAAMGEDSDDNAPAAPAQLPRCADCGACGPAEAMALAGQGLTFRCVLTGKPCAAATRAARPVVQALPGFGTGEWVGPSMPSQAMSPVAAFQVAGAPAVAGQVHAVPAGEPAAVIPGWATTANSAVGPPKLPQGFGMGAWAAAAANAAQMLASAADIAVGDDDDDL